ncbi:MAG: type II toxin-antitoxin system RelE/ParE family toxin [Gammaproteobacteria bacterium]|jgi:plasmid stabilization system protein ParE|nr:addiction module toxin RelE [Chromatiales bacterium]MDP6674784.1 type II toxin-antitoxin system RelE/ParE family toxin [Gammaproteobacteria bacterium]
MKLSFTSRASDDVQSIARFYARLHRSLGVDFINELYRTVSHLPANPELAPRVFRAYRRLTLRRFPYYVIYRIDREANLIRIAAVFHQHRRPDDWRGRVEEPTATYKITRIAA